jgi:hypothetical protein
MGSLKGGGHSEDIGADGRIILKWILRDRTGERGLNSCGSGQWPVAGCFEHGDGCSCSIKYGTF